MLLLYERLIELRRQELALSVGNYLPVPTGSDVVAFVRELGERRFLVMLNLGPRSQLLQLPGHSGGVVVATVALREGESVSGRVPLLGDDGPVIQLP